MDAEQIEQIIVDRMNAWQDEPNMLGAYSAAQIIAARIERLLEAERARHAAACQDVARGCLCVNCDDELTDAKGAPTNSVDKVIESFRAYDNFVLPIDPSVLDDVSRQISQWKEREGAGDET